MKILILCIVALFISVNSFAQKPKKTFDEEKFVKKVQFSMTPELIGKWLPDDEALKYISEKTGKSLGDLKNEKKVNTENIIKNVNDFMAHGLAYIIDKVEVQMKQESPIKIANIVLHCHAKDNKFTITFTNCIQTNISWYLGDGIIPAGDGFDAATTAKAEKKPGKFTAMLIAAGEVNESAQANNKELSAYADSLRQARPGYETKSNVLYNPEWSDLPLQGYYIKNNDEKVEAVIGYLKPQFLIGLAGGLFICKQADGKKVDALNPQLCDNFKEWVKYDDIKAFYVADQLFTKLPEGNFTVLISEGAIHSYAWMKLVDEKKQDFRLYPVTQKLDGQKYGSVSKGISESALLSMMSDAPQIVQGYRDGKYSLNEAEIRYNIWYEESNPGIVKYFFGKDYGVTKKAVPVASAASIAYDTEMVSKYDKAHQVPKQDYFAGRPNVASAAVASAKPEVRVKKESFIDRLNRIKADGNKVGVLIRCNNIYVNPPNVSEGVNTVKVVGSYGPLVGTEKIADKIAAEFNKGFGVDVFEVVDYSLIPVKDGMNGKMDDWWSTKYKIIIIYDITPYYTAIKRTVNSAGDKEFKAQMKVTTEVLIMSAEDKQQTRLKYITSTPQNWGVYNSEAFVGPPTTDFDIIDDLKEVINPPADNIVIDELIRTQQKYIDKYVNKKSK